MHHARFHHRYDVPYRRLRLGKWCALVPADAHAPLVLDPQRRAAHESICSDGDVDDEYHALSELFRVQVTNLRCVVEVPFARQRSDRRLTRPPPARLAQLSELRMQQLLECARIRSNRRFEERQLAGKRFFNPTHS